MIKAGLTLFKSVVGDALAGPLSPCGFLFLRRLAGTFLYGWQYPKRTRAEALEAYTHKSDNITSTAFYWKSMSQGQPDSRLWRKGFIS